MLHPGATSRRRAKDPPDDLPSPDLFGRFATAIGRASGHAWAFTSAALAIALWLLGGPVFGWSEQWQLAVNTLTTVVTFLMVFLIQHTQLRDIEAIHIKLDALVLNTKGARNELLDLEKWPEKDLHHMQSEFQRRGRALRGTHRAGHAQPHPSGRSRTRGQGPSAGHRPSRRHGRPSRPRRQGGRARPARPLLASRTR
jgi:low affinity Fe/Cu permease